MLFRIADHWEGPISAAILIVDTKKDIPLVEKMWRDTPSIQMRTDIHLVYADEVYIISK
jgi:hypothetical protein